MYNINYKYFSQQNSISNNRSKPTEKKIIEKNIEIPTLKYKTLIDAGMLKVKSLYTIVTEESVSVFTS